MTGPVEVIIIIVQSCHHQRREPGEVENLVKKKLGKIEERLKESFFVTILLLPMFSAVTAVVISY